MGREERIEIIEREKVRAINTINDVASENKLRLRESSAYDDSKIYPNRENPP
jgi:hypothetical protein